MKMTESPAPKAGKKFRGDREPSDLKKRRIERQRQREADNKWRRKNGKPTPWEARKAARRERRAALRAKGMLPKQERIDGFIVKRVIVDGEPHVVLVYCCKRCENEAKVKSAMENDLKAERATRRANTAAAKTRKKATK